MPDLPSAGPSGPPSLTPQDRRKVARAAALRPLNVLVLVVGAVFFVATLAWWVPLLTLATYGTLVFLGARDPILQQRTLGLEAPAMIRQEQEIPPERRARWLARGETRQQVDDALAEYRKVVAAIETSDDVTRAVLEDTIPRLHAAADRLVDVALQREKAAGNVRDLRRKPSSGTGPRAEDLQRLQARVDEADAEISATHEELTDLRAKVVRISIETDDSRRAAALNASLDELNARLEALGDINSP
ncbi:hypothetical protein GBA63_06145 [Rubrobacter tropicus]|uniref:Uncharacterized protein n=1 Tax=Rubrobacter tropicus TaxID=2653851 RepID=A0A6G8Q768_9ACTN|nr:hypothetical protein [Rubrobacter tropicus]QIN82278.1 hypothetical protein GBA63_06145 [Rubrobacter tropicus]